MATRKRIWLPNQIYHITTRSIRKSTLYKDDEDRMYFLNLIDKSYDKYPFHLSSFCLMKTHYHLLLKSYDTPPSKPIGYINQHYARYYNYKYSLRGPLFESRFIAKPPSNHRGLLSQSRYIHYNPVESKTVKSPESYNWSSYRYYLPSLSIQLAKYMDLSPLLDNFTGSENEKKAKYIEWCKWI